MQKNYNIEVKNRHNTIGSNFGAFVQTIILRNEFSSTNKTEIDYMNKYRNTSNKNKNNEYLINSHKLLKMYVYNTVKHFVVSAVESDSDIL